MQAAQPGLLNSLSVHGSAAQDRSVEANYWPAEQLPSNRDAVMASFPVQRRTLGVLTTMARIPSFTPHFVPAVPAAVEVSMVSAEPVHVDFPPVPPEEIAFALALFVGVVQGQLGSPSRAPLSREEEEEFSDCLRLLSRLCAGEQPPVAPASDAIAYDTSLGRVLLVIWQLHRGHPHQTSICARVLNFYLLTERTAGKAVERWIMPCTEDPKLVLLHPALIEALATAPLTEQGELSETVFLDSVEALATSSPQ